MLFPTSNPPHPFAGSDRTRKLNTKNTEPPPKINRLSDSLHRSSKQTQKGAGRKSSNRNPQPAPLLSPAGNRERCNFCQCALKVAHGYFLLSPAGNRERCNSGRTAQRGPAAPSLLSPAGNRERCNESGLQPRALLYLTLLSPAGNRERCNTFSTSSPLTSPRRLAIPCGES